MIRHTLVTNLNFFNFCSQILDIPMAVNFVGYVVAKTVPQHPLSVVFIDLIFFT